MGYVASSGVLRLGSTGSPVVALPVEEGLGVAVQRLHRVVRIVALLRVVQGYAEGGLLNGVQRRLVPPFAEVGVACERPRCPGGRGRRSQRDRKRKASGQWTHREFPQLHSRLDGRILRKSFPREASRKGF